MTERDGLVRRVFHLGVSRVAATASRAGLFLALGLALSAEDYGVTATLLSLGTLAAMLLDFGVARFLLRASALDADATRTALGGVLVARSVLVLPVLALYLGVARGVLGPGLDIQLAVSFGVYALSLEVAAAVYATLQGERRTTLQGVTSLVLHGFELGLVLGWFLTDLRGALAPLVTGLALLRGVFTLGLVAHVLRRPDTPLQFRATLEHIRPHRRAILAFAVLGAAQLAYAQADVLLLEWLTRTEEVGRYWAAYRVVIAALIPVDLLIAAALPRVARARDEAGRVFRGLHGFGTAWAAPVLVYLALQPDLVVTHLLGDDFASVGPLMSLLAGALAMAYLPPFGAPLSVLCRPAPLALIATVAAVVNVGLNLVWIPEAGALGAAWATLAAYAVLKAGFVVMFRIEGIPILTRELLPGIGVALAWAALVSFTGLDGVGALAALVAGVLGVVILGGRRWVAQLEGAT
ncbi:MAG: polysaccharide biosynthesis C-terminal domain-containing protein [Sandaracinaceae bacterium]